MTPVLTIDGINHKLIVKTECATYVFDTRPEMEAAFPELKPQPVSRSADRAARAGQRREHGEWKRRNRSGRWS